VFAEVTPEFLDDPRLDLFVLPNRLKRRRRRHRWTRRRHRPTIAALRLAQRLIGRSRT
jgi:hypothetical protein